MPSAGFVLPRITIPISFPQVFDARKRGLLNPRDVPFDKTTSGLPLLQKKKKPTSESSVKHISKNLEKAINYYTDNLKKSLILQESEA